MGNRTFSLDDGTTDGDSGPGQSNSDVSEQLGATSLDNGDGDGGNVAGDDRTYDPDRHLGPDRVNADGTYRRKRRRKGSSGSPRKTAHKAADNSASVDTLSKVILFSSLSVSALFKAPEFGCNDAESTALAGALANVLEQFDIRPDPKVEAIFGLIMVSATIFGPKAYLYNQRIKEARKETKEPTFDFVVQPPYNPEA